MNIRIGRGPSTKRNRDAQKFIYFARHTRKALVKIGISSNLARRLTVLSRNSGPLELIVAFPGSRIQEQLLHARFAAIRVSTFGNEQEWYRATPEILRYAESHREAATVGVTA